MEITIGIAAARKALIAYEEFVNMNKTDSDEPFKVKKGVKSGVVYDPGLQRVVKRLAEKISEINLPFLPFPYNSCLIFSRRHSYTLVPKGITDADLG